MEAMDCQELSLRSIVALGWIPVIWTIGGSIIEWIQENVYWSLIAVSNCVDVIAPAAVLVCLRMLHLAKRSLLPEGILPSEESQLSAVFFACNRASQ